MIRHARDSREADEYSDDSSLQFTPLVGRPGLRLSGEVGPSSWSVLETGFNNVVSGYGDVHLELAELRYINARGTTLLVEAAEQLGGGRILVLHNPPDVLRRLLELLWPDVETIKMDTP